MTCLGCCSTHSKHCAAVTKPSLLGRFALVILVWLFRFRTCLRVQLIYNLWTLVFNQLWSLVYLQVSCLSEVSPSPPESTPSYNIVQVTFSWGPRGIPKKSPPCPRKMMLYALRYQHIFFRVIVSSISTCKFFIKKKQHILCHFYSNISWLFTESWGGL